MGQGDQLAGGRNIQMQKNLMLTTALIAAIVLGAAGCKKKVVATSPKPVAPKETPAPPPEPPKSLAVRIDTFAVEPTTITQGQTATLRWAVANATVINIEPGIGSVVANGT